jgi:hypothetical protein
MERVRQSYVFVTVKIALLVAVPVGVVTLIGPDLARERTSALIWVGESTVILADGTPPMVTCVARVKFVPVMVTMSGNLPDVGVKEPIVGGWALGSLAVQVTVNVSPLVAVPLGVVTQIMPVRASERIDAFISVEETTITVGDGTPPIVTTAGATKFAPTISTIVGYLPAGGLKDLMTGAGADCPRQAPATKTPIAPAAATTAAKRDDRRAAVERVPVADRSTVRMVEHLLEIYAHHFEGSRALSCTGLYPGQMARVQIEGTPPKSGSGPSRHVPEGNSADTNRGIHSGAPGYK